MPIVDTKLMIKEKMSLAMKQVKNKRIPVNEIDPRMVEEQAKRYQNIVHFTQSLLTNGGT